MTLEAKKPDLSLEYLQTIHDESSKRFEACASSEDKETFQKIVLAAVRVVKKTAMFEDTKHITGVAIAVTKKGEEWPPQVVHVGTIDKKDSDWDGKKNKYTAYALAKCAVLIQNSDLVASSQQAQLPKDEQCTIDGNPVPGGAFAFESGWVIGVSAYNPEIDSATAYSIGLCAGIANDNDFEAYIDLCS